MTIDRYVLFDGCLIGAVGCLTWLAGQLRSQMQSFRILIDARGWERVRRSTAAELEMLNPDRAARHTLAA